MAPPTKQRLCVKGRFGFDYIAHPHRLTTPLIRRDDAPAKGLNVDPAELSTHFREATWEEALDAAPAAWRACEIRRRTDGCGLWFGQVSNEEAYSVPES